MHKPLKLVEAGWLVQQIRGYHQQGQHEPDSSHTAMGLDKSSLIVAVRWLFLHCAYEHEPEYLHKVVCVFGNVLGHEKAQSYRPNLMPKN